MAISQPNLDFDEPMSGADASEAKALKGQRSKKRKRR
jgi:hypothetical protein